MSLDVSLEDLQGTSHKALHHSTNFLIQLLVSTFHLSWPNLVSAKASFGLLPSQYQELNTSFMKGILSMNFSIKFPMCLSLHHDLHHYRCQCHANVVDSRCGCQLLLLPMYMILIWDANSTHCRSPIQFTISSHV